MCRQYLYYNIVSLMIKGLCPFGQGSTYIWLVSMKHTYLDLCLSVTYVCLYLCLSASLYLQQKRDDFHPSQLPHSTKNHKATHPASQASLNRSKPSDYQESMGRRCNSIATNPSPSCASRCFPRAPPTRNVCRSILDRLWMVLCEDDKGKKEVCRPASVVLSVRVVVADKVLEPLALKGNERMWV